MKYHLSQNNRLRIGCRRGVALALLALILIACTPRIQATSTPAPVQPVSSSGTQTAVSTTLPTITPEATLGMVAPQELSLYIAPYLPSSLRQGIQLPDGIHLTDEAGSAELSMVLSESSPTTRWVYALVAPFPTLTSNIPFTELQTIWNSEENETFAGQSLIMDQATYDLYSAWWGKPELQAITILPAEDLLDYAWEHQPVWALIPFEAIEAKWKVLEVDGQSPLHKDFDLDNYPLAVPFGILDANDTPLDSLPEGLHLPISNRNSSKLTVVTMTGVTALVRGTALWMERYGITYPTQDIGPLLRQSDITHISNEIPFSPDCPFPSLPTPVASGQPQPLISFCSSPAYISLLEELGADLVELTGDHFADWGDEAMKYTLDLYAAHNLPVYGGGMNADQARMPLLIENNGNKLAFLGCNIGWPVRRDQIQESALASADHPGAAQCDFEWLSTEIPRLRAEGFQVIFTFQHREYDRMKAEPILVEDFGRIADYGATVVSGSQAHQPHSMAFENGAFIHYGLGNLFFDQYHFCADYACDYAFIDQHFFYDNRYLGVELIPIVFVDLARPRLMTEAERTAYLEKIFAASGWTVSP